jgi:hypothetical protein
MTTLPTYWRNAMTRACAITLLSLAIAACATPGVEKGPDGTIAYWVEVEASEAARIEVNHDYQGTTPMRLRIWGDRDGTFHNFGSYEYRVTASALRGGVPSQTKVFGTGGWFTSEDKIPQRMFFDFGTR